VAYTVKEIFYTLQGEGFHTGRPAVFCRFTGCNLWSGREEDRAKAACKFCDTDFVGADGTLGGKYPSAEQLVNTILKQWPLVNTATTHPFVVLTGGEPLLQVDETLLDCFESHGIDVAIESNGTVLPPKGKYWLTVSPKGVNPLLATQGNELKLVYPQMDNDPSQFEGLSFQHFFLQPLDNTSQPKNIQAAIDYCQAHPKWRLSLQTHKQLGIR
jgi:7-carboxy-7-deazaguanine synthase